MTRATQDNITAKSEGNRTSASSGNIILGNPVTLWRLGSEKEVTTTAVGTRGEREGHILVHDGPNWKWEPVNMFLIEK